MIPNEKRKSIQFLISESMEFHHEVSFIYLQGGHIMHFIGNVHHWNEETDEIRVVNRFNDIVRIQRTDLIAVYSLK
ncbi:YolD-like family protein [Metabacillus idriensis]|uniref:YolD-like family protein n=1 Tax=Metabacillus idriensis TaxID=324768 RepID=UPI003D2B8368